MGRTQVGDLHLHRVDREVVGLGELALELVDDRRCARRAGEGRVGEAELLEVLEHRRGPPGGGHVDCESEWEWKEEKGNLQVGQHETARRSQGERGGRGRR